MRIMRAKLHVDFPWLVGLIGSSQTQYHKRLFHALDNKGTVRFLPEQRLTAPHVSV